jgi:predicted glycosyltransferase involved in capsule biosynthesis
MKDGCDIMLVLDADVLVEKEAVENSMRVAYDLGVVSLPYVFFNRLNDELSTSLLNKELSAEEIRSKGIGSLNQNHFGGAYVLTASTFLRLNGWDERFVGWGYEDNAFEVAHRVLLGQSLHRSAGHAITVEHLGRDLEDMEDNRQRFYEYTQKSKAEMLETISGNNE